MIFINNKYHPREYYGNVKTGGIIRKQFKAGNKLTDISLKVNSWNKDRCKTLTNSVFAI